MAQYLLFLTLTNSIIYSEVGTVPLHRRGTPTPPRFHPSSHKAFLPLPLQTEKERRFLSSYNLLSSELRLKSDVFIYDQRRIILQRPSHNIKERQFHVLKSEY